MRRAKCNNVKERETWSAPVSKEFNYKMITIFSLMIRGERNKLREVGKNKYGKKILFHNTHEPSISIKIPNTLLHPEI